MAKPKRTELEKAHAKRISGWFKTSAECVFAAKRGIREGKPLSAISNVNIAILELSDRIDLEENGTCWNCAKRHTCGEYERLRKARMTCSYCANKGVSR